MTKGPYTQELVSRLMLALTEIKQGQAAIDRLTNLSEPTSEDVERVSCAIGNELATIGDERKFIYIHADEPGAYRKRLTERLARASILAMLNKGK